ncbi:MAG: DNA-3-methyladenine glycosylase I [Acidobacteriota bacterium]
MSSTDVRRCAWVSDDPLEIAYHDNEWGVPTRDEHRLFEMLTLEGAQAGLSWITILRKREGYRRAFVDFDPRRVAAFGPDDVERLVQDASIVRHRGKIESTISNARAVLELHAQGTSLSEFVWSFVGGETQVRSPATLADVPSQTDESRAMSKALKKHGFRFVGPTTCYAFMQAAGLVDDHTIDCFRYQGPSPPSGRMDSTAST